MTNDEEFEKENKDNISSMASDNDLKEKTLSWIFSAEKYQYSYHFRWLGLPIIQFPQDIVATQEIIWKVKPDLIIETGIARGGSLIFYSSLLELLGRGQIIGIDVDIRKHNKIAIENHPLIHRIKMIEGSSIDENIFHEVKKYAQESHNVMVVLDSNHEYEHVLKELDLYSQLVSKDNYLIVFDTLLDKMPLNFYDRPWSKKNNNNPYTAVKEFLNKNDCFEIDDNIEKKLLITNNPSGYLKRIK